jgi:hypothetical protein
VFIGKTTNRHTAGLGGGLQHEVVSLFRRGNINCIVATSVGEEGLDIGEVDLIVCYDTPSSALKNVQRMGRTGRKRSGRVVFIMAEGYEEKGLAKAENTRSTIRSRLTTDVGKFCFYQPVRPNLVLPDEPTPVIIRCERDPADIMAAPGRAMIRAPALAKNEQHALECCFGKRLKYRRVRMLPVLVETESIVSHSFESSLLAGLRQGRGDLEIQDTIEDEVSKLFAVDRSDSGSEDDEAVAKAIRRRFQGVDDDDDFDRPCEPLSMHLSVPEVFPPAQMPKQRDFLDDSDMDEFEAFEDADGDEPVRSTPEIAMDSDVDDDIVTEVLEMSHPKKPISFLDSDDDSDDLVIV